MYVQILRVLNERKYNRGLTVGQNHETSGKKLYIYLLYHDQRT